ncbi:MAG: polysaccharide export protein [Phycisphaerales bacterium]|nr:polysaccharide export protein [Phycisphaerales bacterium]
MGFYQAYQVGLAISVCIACGLAGAGCAPPKYEDLKVFVQAHDHDVVSSIYRIEPPDVIAIESATCPEVDGEIQTVDIDGKISLQLINEVKVSMLTPKEVAAKLEGALARYYHQPEVKVRVVNHASKNIYVFGEVGMKGPVPFTGRDTVLDVLARAQPTFLAWRGRIELIRPSPDPDKRHKVIIDVDRMQQGGDLRDNYLLQDGDIIYVPPTVLGWIGLRVQEVLFPISPVLAAYQMPADVKWTTETYKHWNDDNYWGYRAPPRRRYSYSPMLPR